MNTLWTTLIYQPLANALLFLIAVLPGGSIGLAVIVLTFLVKIALLPLSYQSLWTQIAQKKIQPQVDTIKKTITDKQSQAKAIMELYKKNGIKPFSSILILLVQLPIIIALYTVFLRGVDVLTPLAYTGLGLPDVISPLFLGINLTEKSILLAIIAAVAQFLQVHFSPIMRMSRHDVVNKEDVAQMMAASMQKSMKYILPIMVAFFAAVVPGAVALYWIVSSVVTLLQEVLMYKKITHQKVVTVS